MAHAPHTLIPDEFRVDPSACRPVAVRTVDSLPEHLDAYGFAVANSGTVTDEL